MIDRGLKKMCELDLAGDESMKNVPKRQERVLRTMSKCLDKWLENKTRFRNCKNTIIVNKKLSMTKHLVCEASSGLQMAENIVDDNKVVFLFNAFFFLPTIHFLPSVKKSSIAAT